jgi:hypothetical protein
MAARFAIEGGAYPGLVGTAFASTGELGLSLEPQYPAR